MWKSLFTAPYMETAMINVHWQYVGSQIDNQDFTSVICLMVHLCALWGKGMIICSLFHPQCLSCCRPRQHLHNKKVLNELNNQNYLHHPVKCPPFSSPMTSTRWWASSCMRCSKLFFPNPKFLSIVSANLLCSFHFWTLAKKIPGEKKRDSASWYLGYSFKIPETSN